MDTLLLPYSSAEAELALEEALGFLMGGDTGTALARGTAPPGLLEDHYTGGPSALVQRSPAATAGPEMQSLTPSPPLARNEGMTEDVVPGACVREPLRRSLAVPRFSTALTGGSDADNNTCAPRSLLTAKRASALPSKTPQKFNAEATKKWLPDVFAAFTHHLPVERLWELVEVLELRSFPDDGTSCSCVRLPLANTVTELLNSVDGAQDAETVFRTVWGRCGLTVQSGRKTCSLHSVLQRRTNDADDCIGAYFFLSCCLLMC
jgi:hypothetical protein